ncbi:MAG: hypothetical protein KDD40_00565 [Bdellovibrionales bacterium]|nr:hypothetical protein [Bdellovibrionales bacterium]
MKTVSMNQFALKKKTDLHLARKIWHFIGVMVIAFIYYRVSHSTAIQVMALSAALFTTLDLLRKQLPSLNQILMSIFNPVMRESERTHIAGTTYLLNGAFITMFFFPKPIVLLTLLMLGTADPVASFTGLKMGKDKILGNKTLQGSLAAFAVSTVVAAIYYFLTNTMTERLMIVSLLSGLVGTFSELIPIGKIDDNFSFPIVCALGLSGVYYLFGGF